MDHVLEGRRTFLSHLEPFRFPVIDQDDGVPFYQSAVSPEPEWLQAVRMRIGRVAQSIVDVLTKVSSAHVPALDLRAVVSGKLIISPHVVSHRLMLIS